MKKSGIFKAALMASACIATFATTAHAENFNIPGGDLKTALDSYAAQTGQELLYAGTAVKGIRSAGAKGELSPDSALVRLLAGTGFTIHRDASGALAIVRGQSASVPDVISLQMAQAAPARAAVETVTVTSSKLGGADVQSIPIAITALSQEQLTATQTAGGPDLIKQVPNMTFTKTNFSGYSIQLRGIGTQAISVTTDPAVAVAFNDQPFIRNHFFEQEFFDVSQVQVLRGPQGTLYGRNATAGVVNLTSARPTDQFEAMASGELGNYHQKRFEGMLNIPIIDDLFDIRLAGEWTKRQGYSYNDVTNKRIDGRDLWSGRLTVGWKPVENLQTYLIWEHFSENDDRIRSAKQLCKTDTPPLTVNGVPVKKTEFGAGGNGAFGVGQGAVSQGCVMSSLYSPDAFEVPYAFALPYLTAAGVAGAIKPDANPYANTDQSRNLRVIESALDPTYRAKNDVVEFLADYALSPSVMLTSQTGYNQDSMYSTQDFNRFTTSPGVFIPSSQMVGGGIKAGLIDDNGVFCDPQLGCSDRLVAMDMSQEHAWQFNQEVRLSTNFSSAFNFSLGANYMHYETEENYFVFFNTLSIFALTSTGGPNPLQSVPYVPGVTDNHECLTGSNTKSGYRLPIPSNGGGIPTETCIYMDPNPVTSLNDKGHNYFLSENPYTLNSYAAFGEANYDVLDDVKVTAGLRYTIDRKHFIEIPSELITQGYGYPSTGAVDQNWGQFTGRLVANWSPKLNFTDQTLFYASFAHGYKAGGANPPGAVLLTYAADGSTVGNPIHPLTFKPEFIDAFELGTKNKLLDGALTFNASGFYYNYKAYQISEIVDRTSINLNFDATVKGIEVESTYEPVPGLRFNFAGGWEKTRINDGMKAVDLMDRTAGNSDWMVMKPFVTQASNCVLPKYVVAELMELNSVGQGNPGAAACGYAYNLHVDPLTLSPYDPANKQSYLNGPVIPDYPGYDPLTAPNNGQGFDKNLGGNALPNAPPLTVSAGAQYSMPLTSSWAGTLRADYYWQDYSWARVFNDNPYDRLRGYTTINLAVILTSQDGWQVMLYDKNVFSATAITGTFLNSDDSGLTTNVFLTDPKLIGIRVTKNW